MPKNKKSFVVLSCQIRFMNHHKTNPKIHKSWKYSQNLPLKANQETSQNLETENKQKDLENSPKIPEQNSKNLDKNSSLQTSHQIITVPFQALSKVEEKQISLWQKTQNFFYSKTSKLSTGTMAILALILAFSSILGMAFLANSNNNVLKSASAAAESEPDITSEDIVRMPVACYGLFDINGNFLDDGKAQCSTSSIIDKKIPANFRFQIGNSQPSENCLDNDYGTITYCQSVPYDTNLRNNSAVMPYREKIKQMLSDGGGAKGNNFPILINNSNTPIYGIIGSNLRVEFGSYTKGNVTFSSPHIKLSNTAKYGKYNPTANGKKIGPDIYLEVDNADQRDDTDANYQIFEANGAVIKESEFVACKKKSEMLSGAIGPAESVICFFPNAQAKKNQIKNKETNGGILWCPKGWNFADYDNTPASQTGQSCYVGAGTPKYNEYSSKIDAGQIRQELPNIDPGKIETTAMPDHLKNVQIPDYLGDGVLNRFGGCLLQDKIQTQFQKDQNLINNQVICNQIDNQLITANTICPNGWQIHYYTVYDDLTKDGTKLYGCKTVANNFSNLLDLFQSLPSGKIVKKYGGNTGNNTQTQNGNQNTPVPDHLKDETIKRFDDCKTTDGGISCAKIDGRKIDKALDCPLGWKPGEQSNPCYATNPGGLFEISGGKIVKKSVNQGNNNDKICAQVQTVGQNVNNRQEIKQFPNSCLPDGFERITDQMVAAVAFRMSECEDLNNGNIECKKIDGRLVDKLLDCPKGWGFLSQPFRCSLTKKYYTGLDKLIKLENGLLKDAGSTGKSETKLSDKNITPTTDLLEEIAKSNDINTTKCNNFSAMEKRTCQAQALQTTIEDRYAQCEKDAKSKWCNEDPADLKIGIVAPPSQENSACNPESDMEGKMRPLNDQQCNDRKKGYKGPFNFQTRGKQGTRNCWYFGKKDTKYGCDNFGYLKTTCDLIGRYASSNPEQDFGTPDCKVAVVPTTQEANTIARGVSTIEKTEVGGVPGFIAKDLMPNPRNFTECFEPSETKGGFAKNNTYCNAGGGISVPTPSIPTAWINLGSINVFANVTPVGSTTGIVARGTAPVAATATAAVATGGGAGFNIKGLDLLGINCLFTDESGNDSECLVSRITTSLRNLSYPLAILVLIWAGYQYFIGGVDGKSNGLKAIKAVITGVLLISASSFIISTLQQTATGEFKDIGAIKALIDNIRDLLVKLSSSVAILVIMWGGYKFFFSGLDWEKEGGLKAIKNATIGLAIILIANTMVDTLTQLGASVGEKGNFVAGITAIITPFLTDITSLLFGIASLMAVLVIVWGGYKYFFSGLEISKKDGMNNIRNGVIGLVTVILANQIVAIVKTVVPSTQAPQGSFLNIDASGFYPFFTSIVNGFLVPISTACAVFFMIMGGFYWTTSNGDENKIKKAKKALINAVIGLVIVILAVSIIQIVRFLVGGLNIGITTPSSSITNFVEKWF